jgi:hypothetical protein
MLSPGAPLQGYGLHYGRSRTPLVRVVPDERWPAMWRVQWPDGRPSDLGNLSRCMDAAQQWAESTVLSDLRKKHGVGALNLLGNFLWSRSLVSANKKNDPEYGGPP